MTILSHTGKPPLRPQCKPVLSITLPLFGDAHVHFRNHKATAAFVKAHLASGCAWVLAMPNTVPPVTKVLASDPLPGLSWEEYRDDLIALGGDRFEAILVPLYLSRYTTPAMIRQARSRGVDSAKWYPPHGTTNSHTGDAQPLEHFIENGVFAAMQEEGMILNIHGEMPDGTDDEWLGESDNAETLFYKHYMPMLVRLYPRLRIVCEHITTRTAVAFVRSQRVRKPWLTRLTEGLRSLFNKDFVPSPEPWQRVGATVCPQHLLHTLGSLVRKWAAAAYCMPVLKHLADMRSLRRACIDPDNVQFFCGSDSAPHHVELKQTYCGCAAGCFSGGYVAQLYAQAFEEAGCPLDTPQNVGIFRRFLVDNGNAFYDMPTSSRTFTMVRDSTEVAKPLPTEVGDIIPLPLAFQKPGATEPVVMAWRITHIDA